MLFPKIFHIFVTMDKTQNFINKSLKVHGDRYDYSKVEYKNGDTKVCVICKKHGEFWVTPKNHLKGRNCPKCAIEGRSRKRSKTTNEFMEEAVAVHGNRYDYSKVDYVNNSTKVCIICPKHGEFWQTPSNHLSGKGCNKCARDLVSEKNSLTLDGFIEKAVAVHGDRYDYTKVEYVDSTSKVCVICPIHGEFYVTPSSHLNGCGCPHCSRNAKDTTESFVEKANAVHGDKYDYSNVEYVNSRTPVKIVCPIHGEFTQIPNNHLSKAYGCPRCHAITSKKEDELYEFVCSLVGKDSVVRNTREIIPPLELDMYIPSLSLAIEFNGLKWHSEEFEPSPRYHLSKTEMCEGKGIRLIHVFEDEWDFKKDIVKGIFCGLLNKCDIIYARKCEVREITASESRGFLDSNHIQGYIPSKVNIGLFNNNELISVMTFGKVRINLGQKNVEGGYEMFRYSTMIGKKVIGGASKMFKYFVDKYEPMKVLTYADRRLFLGGVYSHLGFKLDHISKPNYFYVVNNHRENRFKYRKDRLVEEGYDKEKSEHEIMLERKIYRIYDCGCKCYLYEK